MAYQGEGKNEDADGVVEQPPESPSIREGIIGAGGILAEGKGVARWGPCFLLGYFCLFLLYLFVVYQLCRNMMSLLVILHGGRGVSVMRGHLKPGNPSKISYDAKSRRQQNTDIRGISQLHANALVCIHSTLAKTSKLLQLQDVLRLARITEGSREHKWRCIRITANHTLQVGGRRVDSVICGPGQSTNATDEEK